MKTFTTDGDFSQNYKWLIGSILPRPIAWVSTLNEDGSNNVAPFSFFTAVSMKPMIIAFCPLIRVSTGEKKDTLVNIERQKQFVINFVTESNYQMANDTSAELLYGEDEARINNLVVLDSHIVKPKRLEASPIHFECEVRDIISYGEHAGAGSLITGEVKMVHISESILKDGKIETALFKPIGRGAGNDWFRCDSKFEIERKMKAQIQK